MATLASRIPFNADACNEILNQGASVFVALLDNCASEPPLITLTVDADLAIGGDTVQLSSSDTNGTYLRAGTVLNFASGSVTTITDVTVSANTSVEIEDSQVAIVTGETAETFALVELISPQNIPFNLEAKTVDRTDLTSFNESMVKTNNKFAPQIQCIAAKDDKALWQIFEGARTVQDIYAVIYYPSEQLVFGRALISGYNFDGGVGEIQRPQFTLEFQGKDYKITTSFSQAGAAEQELMNDVASVAGLPAFVA